MLVGVTSGGYDVSLCVGDVGRETQVDMIKMFRAYA